MSGTKRSAEGATGTAGRDDGRKGAPEAMGVTGKTGTKEAMGVTGKTASGASGATTSDEAVETCGDASAITGEGLAGLAGGVKYWTGAPAPWS